MVRDSRMICRSLPLLLCAVVFAVSARPQVSAYPTGSGANSNSGTNGRGGVPGVGDSLRSDFPTLDQNFAHRQMIARRDEAKRRMVDGAARLLALTRDLQTDLQSREPNEADAKRLDEIAKLARTVRDQMRQ